MTSKHLERMKRAMTATTLGMLIDFYGADMRLKNRTDDSIRTNLSHLRRFAAHAGGSDVKYSDLTSEVAQAYVEALQARQSKWDNHPTRPAEHKPLSPFTIRKTVKILRGFGAWMARDGLGNPFEELDIPTVPKTLVETLTPEEVRKLLAAIHPNTPNGGPELCHDLAHARLRAAHLGSGRTPDQAPGPAGPTGEDHGQGRKERTIPFGQKTARALMH